MNTLFAFIVRRDYIAQLTAHLAAGLVALALLSSMATATPKQVSPPASVSAAGDALADANPLRR